MAGRSVLVTGCSDGGLGSALALAFHKKGYRVIATARNVNKMGEMKSNNIETVSLDVLSEDSIKQCVQQVSKILDGKLDILVNNAGGGYSMPIMDIKLPDIKDLFDLNVFSLISISQAFLPLLRRSSDAVIANNTSIAALIGIPVQSAYNASKAAASSLTAALRLELEPFGVKVVDLKTGAVKTKFFANLGAAELPADSIYAPARNEIQSFMAGGGLMDNAITADVWAARVVADLSTPAPAYIIWRGKEASLVWWISFLPIWLFDSMLKKTTGLTVLAQRLKAQASGIKQA